MFCFDYLRWSGSKNIEIVFRGDHQDAIRLTLSRETATAMMNELVEEFREEEEEEE